MKPCPSCGSNDSKKASLIHQQGAYATKGMTISTSGVVGLNTAKTESALSLKCKPPIMPTGFSANSAGNIFVVVIILSILNALFGGNALSWGGLIFSTLISWSIAYRIWIKKATATHKTALEEYDKIFVCMRCGESYKPFDEPSEQ